VTSENDRPNPPPVRQTIVVPAYRLAWGKYDHDKERDIGEGDIHASYSADTIATHNRVRRLFKWHGQLMVNVGMSGRGGVEQAEAYRLTPKEHFAGMPTTYQEKVNQDGGEAARNDPNGFYDRIIVTYKKQSLVLTGPPVVFITDTSPDRPQQAAEPAQLSLF
jgi:hypothetical protein